MTNKTGHKFIYKIELVHPALIGNAYQDAITKHRRELGDEYELMDVWDGHITLLRIEFQENFRRLEYEAVFEITDFSNSPKQVEP